MLSADRQCSAPASPPVLSPPPGTRHRSDHEAPGLIGAWAPHYGVPASRSCSPPQLADLWRVITDNGPICYPPVWAQGCSTVGARDHGCIFCNLWCLPVEAYPRDNTAALLTKPSMTRGWPQLVLVKMSLHGCMLSVVSFIWQSKNIHPCRLQITHCTASKGTGIVGEAWTQLVLDTPQTQDLCSWWTRV